MDRFNRSFAAAGLAALALVFGACQSYNSAQDLRDARTRIQSGQGQEQIQGIVANYAEIPAGLRDEAIQAVASDPSARGQQAVVALLEHPATSSENRTLALSLLVARNEPQSAPAILAAVESEPGLATPDVLTYFGRQKTEAALPLLERSASNPALSAAAIDALLAYRSEASYDIVLGLARKSDNVDVRLNALTAVRRIDDALLQEKARVPYRELVANYQTEPRELVQIAFEELAIHNKDDLTFDIFRDVYNATTDPDIKRMSLASMALIRGVDPSVMEAQLRPKPVEEKVEVVRDQRKPALTDADSRLEYLRNRERTRARELAAERAPHARVTTRARAGARPGAYPADYRRRLDRAFDAAFQGDSQILQNQIHSALLSYRDSDEDKAQFIYRSYRRQYGGDDEGQRERLKDGINYPGSLSSVVWNVIEEYPDDPLRIFALSQLFAIKRWQATILLQLVRENRI